MGATNLSQALMKNMKEHILFCSSPEGNRSEKNCAYVLSYKLYLTFYQTPLHQAALNGDEDITNLLLDFNADFTLSDASGLSPLDLARRNGQKACTNALQNAKDTQDGLLTAGLLVHNTRVFLFRSFFLYRHPLIHLGGMEL